MTGYLLSRQFSGRFRAQAVYFAATLCTSR
jgi:hypothetical protein